VPPGIHSGKVVEPQPRFEQPLAHHAHLVFDLAVGPAYAAFGHGSAQPRPEAGVQATGSTR
jgi:hypothetical protein